MRTWALELECAKMDKQRRNKAWMKRWILIPLYGRMRLCIPTSLVKLACLPSAVVNGVVRVTHVRIDENPVKRVRDLCFDKTCQGNRLAKRVEVGQ